MMAQTMSEPGFSTPLDRANAQMGRFVMNAYRDDLPVAMPWYEEEDFARLWAISHDEGGLGLDYAGWYSQACEARRRVLASGRALEIVTVRPAQFLAWLDGRPNTAEARLRYVRELAAAKLLN